MSTNLIKMSVGRARKLGLTPFRHPGRYVLLEGFDYVEIGRFHSIGKAVEYGRGLSQSVPWGILDSETESFLPPNVELN